jgi:hypothetical protein
MNTQSSLTSRSRSSRAGSAGLGRALLALAGVLLVGLGTAALASNRPGQNPPPSSPPDDPDPGNGNSGNSGMPSMEDESIGSLPMLGTDVRLIPPGMALPGLAPSLCISGPGEVLLPALLGARGRGALQILDLGGGRLSIVVQGALELDFDLAPFHGEHLEVGLLAGAELGQIGAAMFYRGRSLVRRVLEPREELRVPLREMLAVDDLKSGVDLLTADLLGGRSHHRLVTLGGVLRMRSGELPAAR